MDEKAFRKGHNYLTVVNDLRGSRVLYVAEDREQKSLDGFWGTLTEEQRALYRRRIIRIQGNEPVGDFPHLFPGQNSHILRALNI